MSGFELSDRDRLCADPPRSPYLWCLHCERTYNRGEWRTIGAGSDRLQMCPYPGCDGDAVVDAWDWADVRDYYPQYPEVPVRGERYPLYPEAQR